jgi:hypothetical protein
MLLFELEHCSSRDRIWKLPCLQCDHQQAIAMRKWHRFVFRGKTVKREDRDGSRLTYRVKISDGGEGSLPTTESHT